MSRGVVGTTADCIAVRACFRGLACRIALPDGPCCIAKRAVWGRCLAHYAGRNGSWRGKAVAFRELRVGCVFRVFQPDGRFGSGREGFGRYVSAGMHARRGMACRGRVHVCRGVFRLPGGVGGALLRPAPPCGQPVAAVACAIWCCTVPCPARPGFPRPAVRGIALSWLLRMLRE